MNIFSNKSISADLLIDHVYDQTDSIILDVRQREEFEEWSIKNALNIPLNELPDNLNAIPKDKKILVICASGNRSRYGCKILKSSGYDAVNVDGGMFAWSTAYDTVNVDVDGLELIQLRRVGKGCLSYMIIFDSQAYVIDPTVHLERYIELAQSRNSKITAIFDTHLHADHLSGSRLLSSATGAQLYLNPADNFHFEFTPLKDNQKFNLTNDLYLSVTTLSTPGHTNGSVVFNIANRILLTGDTLFVDGIGRPDLADKAVEFADNLYESLHGKLLKFNDDTVILPAHFGSDTPIKKNKPVSVNLGTLKHTMEPLSLDKKEFMAWVTNEKIDRPPFYQEIIKSNMGISNLGPEVLVSLEMGPNRCSI